MAQGGARPVPARRRMPDVDMSSKNELVQSFVGFNSSTVTEEHMRLARKCIDSISTRGARYERISFHMILQWNQEKNPACASMIAQACDLLLKYVINLLKPKRPQVWRSIKITNSHFCARVDCMIGARDILKIIGYSEEDSTAMQFPDHVKEPDKEKLQVIAAELLMAKLEAEDMQGGPVIFTRQFSNPSSQTSSHPGTPSEPQSLSPSVTQRPPPLSSTLSASQTVSPTNTNLMVPSTSPLPTHQVNGTGTGSPLTTPASSLHSFPQTEAFTPHSGLHPSPYEEAQILRASQDVSPNATQAQSSSGPTSLNSSGDSNYGTPPSSTTSPNATDEQQTTSETGDPVADLKHQLETFRNRKIAIKGKISKKKMATAGPTVSVSSQDEKEKKLPVARATSYQGTISSQRPPSHPKPQAFSPIIEEELTISGGLQTRPPPPPQVPPVSAGTGGQVSGTPCPHCNHLVQTGQIHCDYCKRSLSDSSVTSQLPPPLITEHSLQKHSSPLRASAESAEKAIQQHRMKQPGPSSSSSSNVHGATAKGEPSFIETIDKKFAAWRDEWLKRGYTDAEIPREPASVPLPPYKNPPPHPPVDKEAEKKEAARKKATQNKKKAADFEKSKNALQDLERYEQEAKRNQLMKEIGEKGESLMECIKFCVQHSFALEEITLGYKKFGKPTNEAVLQFLRNNWRRNVRELRQYVSGMSDNEKRSVGVPSDLEARRFLVQASGNVYDAAQLIFQYRQKKIEELQVKFRQHQELRWEEAVLALSVCDMNVEKAVCSIQCESLEPLYEFIFSEWTEVPATDMKKIKERLKKVEGEEEKTANLRMLMGEFKLPNMTKAGMVVELMNRVEVDAATNYPLSYYIDAAKDYKTLEEAEHGLIKECPICTLEVPVHETITMPGCTDTMCIDCFKGHFQVVITEKGVKHFNCPTCDKPDMTNRDDAQDLYQELFVDMIHQHLSAEYYDLVQTKLSERNLQKDPGFRWCVNEQCRNCFINPNPERKKIQCPICRELMCFQCKKPWEDQHNGLSCDEFAEWKRQNDPKFQKEGLAAHLQANGIECPDCHMRYELARGGCMHFKCTRCPNEFCSGCGGSFKKAHLCGRFQSCAKKGLHAHHPRDCLYFMRDFSVDELQEFLGDNDVEFETQPSPDQLQGDDGEEDDGEEDGEDEPEAAEEGDEKKVELRCSVMLQKEGPEKLVDEPCGDEVKDGHAGLCEKHYKEYLVDRINKAKLDPIPLYEENLGVLLGREEKPVPEKEEEETDENYKQRLIEHIKAEVPLERGGGGGGGQQQQPAVEPPEPVAEPAQ